MSAVTHITAYIDFHSPGVAEAFAALPLALMGGGSYTVTYKPVALGAVPADALQRLHQAIASHPDGLPSRVVCATLLAGEALTRPLSRSVDDPLVAAQLQAHTAEAQALGITTLPAFVVDGQVFVGEGELALMSSPITPNPSSPKGAEGR